jgi:Domain of unknown function (DUF397)
MNETTGLSRTRWFKSSFSNGQGGACVEAAASIAGSGMAVRDSKHPDGPVLLFSPDQWRTFTEGVKLGEPR